MSGLQNGFMLLFACSLLLAAYVSANKQQKQQNQGKKLATWLGAQRVRQCLIHVVGVEKFSMPSSFAGGFSSHTKINKNRFQRRRNAG